MSTLYLHIGTPKTGTTAIQKLLAKNRSVLEKHGIIFPDYGFYYKQAAKARNGHFLIQFLKAPREQGCAPQLTEDREKGLDLLAQTAKQFDRIILSDEKLWNGSRMIPNYWTDLKRDLDERQISLRLIVYLRRQDLLMQSLYGHNICRSNITCSFPEFLQSALAKDNPFCLDYNGYLCELAELFGWDSLIIRIYEKEQFQGPEKNLLSDFLNIFGLRMEDGFSMEQTRYNERMSKSYLETRRILNHLPLPASKEPLLTMTALQGIRLPDDDTGDYTWFEPDAQREFMERYREGNSQLARTYFGREDGALFLAPPQELPLFRVEDREILAHAILAYGKTIRLLEKENMKLRREMTALRAEQARQMNAIRALREDVIWYRLKRKASHILKKD